MILTALNCRDSVVWCPYANTSVPLDFLVTSSTSWNRDKKIPPMFQLHYITLHYITLHYILLQHILHSSV